MEKCTLCPRKCGTDRRKSKGVCGGSSRLKIARAMPHFWEEPCISGERGSGAIFFSGCTLRCSYCQNYEISSGNRGRVISQKRFEEILFELKEKGVHNINLVTADHYVEIIAPILARVKGELGLPIVFNCSGYESEEMLALLDGIVDIYLADYKYADNSLGLRFSRVPDYADVAKKALKIMHRQVGDPVFDEKGMLLRGLVVRHLVLPFERKNSLAVIESLGEMFSPHEFILSLMSQYTPNGRPDAPSRPLVRFEYQSVMALAQNKAMNGYFQAFSSQSLSFLPKFDGEGVTK
ncbi:MAG: radical SAM protein [Clostridia bacterium]|nr:radical SAM protein [Clostridia bacterium]